MRSLSDDRLLPGFLKSRLSEWPGGAAAASPMAAQLSFGRYRGPAPQSARPAAVLLMLVWRQDEWRIPLAVRPQTVRHHRGQIGLPGGRIEPGESSRQAALREFREELGLLPDCRLLGRLPSCYVFASDFEVTPWVAVANASPQWSPCPAEVERVVELPLSLLMDHSAVGEMIVCRGPLEFRAPCYHVGNDCIWGATAVILSGLARLASSGQNGNLA